MNWSAIFVDIVILTSEQVYDIYPCVISLYIVSTYILVVGYDILYHSDSYVLFFVSCSMVLHRCHIIKFIIETIEESFFTSYLRNATKLTAKITGRQIHRRNLFSLGK